MLDEPGELSYTYLRHLVLLSPKTDNHVSAILTLDVSPATCSITLGDTVLPQ